MSRSGAQATPEQRVLRMRGLPFNSTEADIKEFFGSSYRLETVKICVRAGRIPREHHHRGTVSQMFVKASLDYILPPAC